MIKKEMFSGDVINYEEGVKRFSGNQALYEKYLIRFLEDTHLADGQNAFREKDYQEMMMQMHPLKGMAGTLGMNRLFLACDEVVKALRQEQESGLKPRMEHVEQEYQQVIELLKSALEEENK